MFEARPNETGRLINVIDTVTGQVAAQMSRQYAGAAEAVVDALNVHYKRVPLEEPPGDLGEQ